jgi:hypothetical protein
MYKIILDHQCIKTPYKITLEKETGDLAFDEYYAQCDSMCKYVRLISSFTLIVKIKLINPQGECLQKLTLTNL